MKTLVVICLSIVSSVFAECPSGFVHHGDSCYAIPMSEGSWADGMMICQEMGAQLAILETTAEQTFIEGFLQRYGSGLPNDHDFWLGGGDFLQEGIWKWVMTDTTIDAIHSSWAEGQPDNHGGTQGCLRISASLGYKWEDGNCDSVEYPLCEKAFQTIIETKM